MDDNVDCSTCRMYNDFGQKKQCLAGMWEVQIVGYPLVSVEVPSCEGYDPVEDSQAKTEQPKKVDKRSKAYKESIKNV